LKQRRASSGYGPWHCQTRANDALA
jgi:hypothetical protein